MSDLRVRFGAATWAIGGLVIAIALARSWWDLLFLPLGDSHDGRINGRFGLQVRNLADDGLIGSGFASSIEPFSTNAYAHHPPLINYLHAAVRVTLGEGEWQLHLVGFVAGLVTIGALLWLAHELGFRALPAVAATAVVASTPMFWIYARLGLGISLVLLYLAMRARARNADVATGIQVAAAAVVALSSWVGAGLVVLLALIDLRDPETRDSGRRSLLAGVGVTVAVLLWAVVVSAPGELSEHASSRLRLPMGIGALVEQYRWFYQTLFPTWFRWSIPALLAVAVAAPRTRRVVGPWLAVFAAWSLALPEAVFVHDYWTYPLMGMVALGGMTIVEWVADNGAADFVLFIPLVLAALITFNSTLSTGYREAYFEAPADAGLLLQTTSLPADQPVAWAVGIELPRWVSYYWDVPVGIVDESSVADLDAEHLVMLRMDRLPDWIGAGIEPTSGVGRYVLVPAGELLLR